MVQIAREWDQLSAATRKEIRDLRGNGFGQLKGTAETPHFVLHYTTQGDWAVPSADADRDGTPDFIEAAAKSWEEVYARQVGQLGYPAPRLTVDPATGAVSQKVHVYFKDMPYYGYCVPENVAFGGVSPSGQAFGTASAWIVVENDFAGFPPNDVDLTGTETVRRGALEVTQAHEFMHALQFNLNVYQSGWLMESHATWSEDAVYDDVNDWHWYINRFIASPDRPLFSRFVYGAAVFQNWMSETYGVGAPLRVWQAASGPGALSAAEAVKAAALGGSWAPMQAFAAAQGTLGLSDFTTDRPSTVQPDPARLLRASHAAYPVDVSVPAATRQVPNRAPWGLGANYVEFTPGAAAGDLTLAVDGADGYAWRAQALVTDRSGTEAREIRLDDAKAGTLVVPGFGRGVSRVVLAVTIADRSGAQVPFRYSARVGAAVATR
jgi:hypothetical protein